MCYNGLLNCEHLLFFHLKLFLAAEGVMLASFTVYFEAESVLIAVVICAGVVLALTLFAFQTKFDFTSCGGMLCSLLFIIFVMEFQKISMNF